MKETKSNSFLAVLQKKETQVGVLTELSQLLATAVIAAQDTGKKASVSVTLELEPKDSMILFKTATKLNLPKKKQPACVFFGDADGNLYRDNPQQEELALTSHDGGRAVTPEPATQEEATTANAAG